LSSTQNKIVCKSINEIMLNSKILYSKVFIEKDIFDTFCASMAKGKLLFQNSLFSCSMKEKEQNVKGNRAKKHAQTA